MTTNHTSALDAPTTRWGEIQGRAIDLPMVVEEFDAATFVFSVPADVAAVLLPGDAFTLVETAPGTAQLVLALCDYRRNPWGDYLEINVGFLARPVGAPDDVVGSFVYRMPVDQAFTCEAGNRVMGFPKTVEDLRWERDGDRVAVSMSVDGTVELGLSFTVVDDVDPPGRIDTVSYSYLDGVAHQTPLGMDQGTQVLDPSTVRLELGPGVVGDELRSLGLPAAPDVATWGTGLAATFGAPTPLDPPPPSA